jgi:hypothetical protein
VAVTDGSTPLLADGGIDRDLSVAELAAHLDRLVDAHGPSSGRRRFLLVPPDHARLHSRAGLIPGLLHQRLTAAGCHVTVLPALGTHAEMTPADVTLLFEGRVPPAGVVAHRWRSGLVRLGQIEAS